MADTDVYEYQALDVIRSGNVVAFQPGDLVPADTVAAHDLESAGLVRRVQPPRGQVPVHMVESSKADDAEKSEGDSTPRRQAGRKPASRKVSDRDQV